MTKARRAAPARTRPYHHGNLRRALLDEALTTIRDDGVGGLTLREIGARVGVSRTALYRHFTDKRALLAAVATEGFSTLRQRLVASWESGGRNRAGFDAMGVAYVQFAIENPAHYRVMFGGFLDPDAGDAALAEASAGAFAALVEALTILQGDGLIRDDDSVTMARFVWSLVHGLAMLAIDTRVRDPGALDELMKYAFDRLQTGIAAPDRAPRRSRPSGATRAKRRRTH